VGGWNVRLGTGGRAIVRTIITIIFAGLLGGYITQSAGAQGSAEHKAPNAFANCVADSVTRLDDGKSDAATIAHGVQSACHWERELMLAEMSLFTFPDDPSRAKDWRMR
jgi:hypothetical protein